MPRGRPKKKEAVNDTSNEELEVASTSKAAQGEKNKKRSKGASKRMKNKTTEDEDGDNEEVAAPRVRKVTASRSAPPQSRLTYYASWKHFDDLIKNSNVKIDANDIMQINALVLDVIANYLNGKKN